MNKDRKIWGWVHDARSGKDWFIEKDQAMTWDEVTAMIKKAGLPSQFKEPAKTVNT